MKPIASSQHAGTQMLTSFVFGIVGILIAIAGITTPLYAILGYAFLLVCILVRVRPDIMLMLIMSAAFFQNDVSGGGKDSGGGGSVAFSLAELLLAVTLPVFLVTCVVEKRAPRIGPVLVPVLLYLGVCFSASALNWHGLSALISLPQIAIYLIVTVMVFASLVKTERLWLILQGFACVGCALALVQLAGLTSSIGLNKNGIGASLASVVIVCVELVNNTRISKQRTMFMIILALSTTGLVLSVSRGAWLAATAGVCFILALRREFKLLAQLGTVLCLLVAMAWQFLPDEKKDYAFGFDASRVNISARYRSIASARSYFEQSPIIGVGVGLRKEIDATNIFWFTLGETGILGLLAFGGIHVVYLRMIWVTHKRVPNTDKRFSLLAIGGALVMGKLAHGMVDHYWTRGHLLIAWAAAGMATNVYYSTRPQISESAVADERPREVRRVAQSEGV